MPKEAFVRCSVTPMKSPSWLAHLFSQRCVPLHLRRQIHQRGMSSSWSPATVITSRTAGRTDNDVLHRDDGAVDSTAAQTSALLAILACLWLRRSRRTQYWRHLRPDGPGCPFRRKSTTRNDHELAGHRLSHQRTLPTNNAAPTVIEAIIFRYAIVLPAFCSCRAESSSSVVAI